MANVNLLVWFDLFLWNEPDQPDSCGDSMSLKEKHHHNYSRTALNTKTESEMVGNSVSHGFRFLDTFFYLAFLSIGFYLNREGEVVKHFTSKSTSFAEVKERSRELPTMVTLPLHIRGPTIYNLGLRIIHDKRYITIVK